MSAQVHSITMTVADWVLPTVKASVTSLATLEPRLSDSAIERVQSLIDAVEIDIGALIAFRTDKAIVSFEPSERYLRDVAAVAAGHVENGVIRVEWRHGWPILSVECGNPTVAEAGGAINAPGGGAA